MTCTIKRSEKGPYYEMTVDGQFCGNYDTVKEASEEFEQMKQAATDEEVPA